MTSSKKKHRSKRFDATMVADRQPGFNQRCGTAANWIKGQPEIASLDGSQFIFLNTMRFHIESQGPRQSRAIQGLAVQRLRRYLVLDAVVPVVSGIFTLENNARQLSQKENRS